MLEPFGIDEITQSVYIAMLGAPTVEVPHLAKILEQDEAVVLASLDKLSSAGLASAAQDSTSRWNVVNPEVGLPALLARQQAEIAAQQARMEQGRMSIAMLLSQCNGLPSTTTSVERLIGIDVIRAKLAELAAACRSAVWSLNPGGAHSPLAIKSSRDLTAESLSRGIEVRSIHNDSVRNDPPTLQHLQELDRMGAAVRTHPVIPIRMIIADRERIIVPVDTQHTAASALLITGTGLVEALTALYLHTWEQAKPLTTTRSRRELELNDQERFALRLWAKGDTDATVAKKLGVSERTVRRISETVAEKLRTKSRFQAGAKAVFAGWITEDDTI